MAWVFRILLWKLVYEKRRVCENKSTRAAGAEEWEQEAVGGAQLLVWAGALNK